MTALCAHRVLGPCPTCLLHRAAADLRAQLGLPVKERDGVAR